MGNIMIGRFFQTIMIAAAFIPGTAMAQNVVAMYTPGMDFQDGAARNLFVGQVAELLSSKTGQVWEGRAYSRASDFEAARKEADVAIIDADYFSVKSSGFKPVAMLSSDGQVKRPLKVIAHRGNGDNLYQYRHKRIALVQGTSLPKSFVTSTALGFEAEADSYFSIDEVRDVRSAINAVDMGTSDLALVFDGYDRGFTTIYTAPSVGLPVIAVNTSRLSDDQADRVQSAFKSASLKTSFVTGTASYDDKAATAYKRIAQAKKSDPLNYQPVEPENIKLKPSQALLPVQADGVQLNRGQVNFLPSLEKIDRRLQNRL